MKTKTAFWLIIGLLSIFPAFSQQVLNKKTFQYTSLKTIATDGQNLYVAGSQYKPGSFKLVQGVVVKLDKDLNTIWEKDFGDIMA